MSPLVLGEILVVFVNRLTADGKYLVQDWENLAASNSNAIIAKTEIFFWIFCSITGISIKF